MESRYALHLLVVTVFKKDTTNSTMTRFMIFLLFSVGFSQLTAQQWGEIHGKVFDSDGEPVAFANVLAIAADNQIGTTTDLDGSFRLKPLTPGVYNITISFIGKHSFQLAKIPVRPDEVTFIDDVALVDFSVELPYAEVPTYAEPLIRVDGVSKVAIRSEDLEHNPARRNLQGIVQTITPAVTVDPATQELHFKGSRAGNVVYFIDGMKVMGSFGGIPAAGVGSVSVYTGGIPAKYGDTTGGVIVIESKNYFDLYNAWVGGN